MKKQPSTDWTKQRLGRIPRMFAVAYWSAVATLAGGLVFFIWPEPYNFRVSQTTFKAAEEVGGEYVPLDDYKTGYKKLAEFERKCQVVFLLLGICGACIPHLVATLIDGRDVTFAIVVVTIPLSMLGIWLGTISVPETVDPVYGDGFRIPMPLWVDVFLFGALAFFAASIELCLLAIRYVLGKLASHGKHSS